jgi:hypothetical protein
MRRLPPANRFHFAMWKTPPDKQFPFCMNLIQLAPQSNRARKLNSAVTQRTLCCVVFSTNCQQSALLIAFSLQFSEHVAPSVMKTVTGSACFVLFLLSNVDVSTDRYPFAAIPASLVLRCVVFHLFLVRHTFSPPVGMHSHTDTPIRVCYIFNKFRVFWTFRLQWLRLDFVC